jgi:hypothetical protein
LAVILPRHALQLSCVRHPRYDRLGIREYGKNGGLGKHPLEAKDRKQDVSANKKVRN